MNRLGAYETLIEIAAGGMATVFVGRQLGAAGFERLVAIKRVHRHLLGNREFCDMFRDEARVSSAIRHPNVVSATDVVEVDGELLLIMDYVESVSLARTDRDKPLPPPIASRILVDVLSGLHAAHEAVDLRGMPLAIIHRDVSPQNIVTGVDGVSRLIDFGIAKAAARLAETSGASLRGKLRYMAPEQVTQRPLDRRADIFAAGVVLYEALTARRLFDGEDEGDIALGVLVAEIEPPSRHQRAVSSELDAVVLRALARDREERWPTAAAMADALERACPPAPHRDVAAWLASRAGAELAERRERLRAALDRPNGAVVPSPAPSSRTGPDDVTETATTATPTPVARRRRASVALGAALALLATTTLAAAWIATARRPPAPAPSAATTAPASTPPPPASSVAVASPPSSASASARPTKPSEPPRPPPRPRTTGDLHRNPYAR